MHDAIPTTPAIRALRAAKADFTAHSYKYEERGGTAQAARELGIDEHRIVKTIVLKDAAGKPLVMLMHGDREISTKNLARALGEKAVELCEDYIDVIPGVEITHVPPCKIARVAEAARGFGAEWIVVHGETVVEPV